MTIDNLTDEEFVERRISHNSGEEYFRSIGEVANNYTPTHLSITHIEKSNSEFSHHAELALAKKAKEKGCRYATNLDYCQFNPEEGFMILAATGWLPKKQN